MKVLITGVDGYIGAILAPYLGERGHVVGGVDCGFYRNGWLYDDGRRRPAPATLDVRKLDAADVVDFDAVVHLAELSNDPLGELNERLTYAINHQGSVELARTCRDAGVRRFVYASSCSVYGKSDGETKSEISAIDPQTAYARCKALVERDVAALADEHFTPVFLRNATAYGASPRMRFDIVLNNLAGHASTTGEVKMTSDGTPWRPLVHVNDICEAILLALEAPREAVLGEVLNVGSDDQNYRVREIAEIIARTFPGCVLTYGAESADNRSYRVSFAKIRRHLPGFRCRWTAERGARQLRDIFAEIGFSREVFHDRAYTRLAQLKYLMATRQLDGDFYFRAPVDRAAEA